MKKPFALIPAFCLFTILISFTVPVSDLVAPIPGKETSSTSPSITPLPAAKAISLYSMLELDKKGLSREAFEYAWKGYQKLLSAGKISKPGYLTICDFSQPSNQKRLYLLDIERREVIMNTWVAHGRNSGTGYASRFSNRPESLQSSLGFYTTCQTYTGKHGLSLRLDGLERGINDKAMQRAIVIHGADYIGAGRLKSGFMGRSFGCPAVPNEESPALINIIKNGTCLFIYHPAKSYLLGSTVLNG